MAGSGRVDCRARRWPRCASAADEVASMSVNAMTSRRPAPRRAGAAASSRSAASLPPCAEKTNDAVEPVRAPATRAMSPSTARSVSARSDSVPGKARVLGGAAERQRRQAHRLGDARAEALGQRLGDPGVGGERQMRAVLLGGAERHARRFARRRAARRVELRPGRASSRRRRAGRCRARGARRVAGAAGAATPVQRPIAAAAGPARLIDAARGDGAQHERVQQRLVLEQRLGAGQGRRQAHDSRCRRRVEHALAGARQRGLAGGAAPRCRTRNVAGRSHTS